MKPGTSRLLPQPFALLAAPFLTLTYASADIVIYNEANATGVWTTVGGTNLLNGGSVAGTPAVHEGSSPNWTTLTDGILAAPGAKADTVTPDNNTTIDFPLDVVAQPGGYDIATFDSWVTWPDSGRSNQNYILQYSKVGAPTTFLPIATVANVDLNTHKSTHTTIMESSFGAIATEVHTIRLITGAAQENGWVGFTELKALAVPTNMNTLAETDTSTSWTLPAGTNLLKGNVASPATTSTQEGSSPNWSTVTDGTLGTSANIGVSVTPPNLTSVVFPLDLSVNTNGYKLSSLDTYCAWPNTGRDNQDIEISYSTVAAPTTFIRLGHAVAHTGGSNNSTHVRFSPVSGFLARNVAFVRMSFGYQENGYVGYREFIALGSAEPLVDPLTWTGASGSAGNASWVNAADNNWKRTDGGTPATYNPSAELTFDQTGNNRNISVPAEISASVVTLANNGSTAYTFGGQRVTVTNSLVSTGTGNATFNNAIKATTGVTQSGSGTLTFNGALEAAGLQLNGSGGIILNGANPGLTGSAVVDSGTLTVANNGGLQNAGVATTGGVIQFTSAAPHIQSLSGPVDTSVVLGNTTGPVNTTLDVGDANPVTVTTFAGNITQAAGTTSGLAKSGTSTLILTGNNAYTGPTNVSGGILQFNKRSSLYGANDAAWTAANLLAGSGGTLALNIASGEFTEAELNALPLEGFQPGSALGIETAETVILSRDLTRPGMGILKTGTGKLTLTGNNTANGLYEIRGGVVEAGSTTGHSIGGSVFFTGAIMDLYLNMAANDQFAPGSVLTYNQGNFYNTKLNLRGTSQTIAGLDSAPSPVNLRVVIQNDELGNPGSPDDLPGPATLTIDTAAASNHSYYGIIRDKRGGAVTLVKKGTGTQELINSGAEGYGYTGPTNIEAGALRLNFVGGTSGFGSNVNVSSGASFELDGTFVFVSEISGAGDVVKRGTGTVTVANALNTYSGATKVTGGVLILPNSTLADASTVEIADLATLNLTHADTDVIGSLFINGVQKAAGIYAAVGNGGEGITEDSHITGTGKLQVSSGGATVTYEAWAAIIPNAADRDRTDDPDGDGFNNLMEFLFGTSPVASTGSLTPIEVTPGGLIIHWNQRATGSSVYVLQESTTLLDNPWPISGATITNSAVQNVPDYIRKEALIPYTGAKKFVRVNGTE